MFGEKGCREMASEHQLSWGSLTSRVAGEEWWEQDGPEPMGLSSSLLSKNAKYSASNGIF